MISRYWPEWPECRNERYTILTERKQGNEHGIQGALVETWGRMMNCQDTVDQMEVDVGGIINWVDRAENTLVEVDEQVERLEWELANLQRDMVMLVAERMGMANNWDIFRQWCWTRLLLSPTYRTSCSWSMREPLQLNTGRGTQLS